MQMTYQSPAVLELCAYLIRQAAGLDDNAPVVLDVGAESVRKMALRALREHDRVKNEIPK